MNKLMVLVAIPTLLLLLACGGGLNGNSEQRMEGDASVMTTADSLLAKNAARAEGGGPTVAPVPAMAPREAGVAAFAAVAPVVDQQAQAMALETAQRRVISSASVSIQVEVVQEAIIQVRTIAQGLGGFVEQLSSFGSRENQRATITVRVPQDQFQAALDRIEALGEVQSRNEGSEDVSERFIDLEARLESSRREEQSLLSLLGRTSTVSEVLAIERELARVRSEIERLKGQLSFLERRVELATITVSLSPPPEPVARPPSASLSVAVSGVTGSVEGVKGLVDTMEGIMDKVFLSVLDGKERGDLSFRVPTAEFQGAIDFLVGQGQVKSKEIREGTGPGQLPANPTSGLGSTEPEARIDVVFSEKGGSVKVGLIVGIAALIGGLVLSAILVIAWNLAYQRGRRSRRYI